MMSSLDSTPDWRHNGLPFWNKIIVGTPRTWYWAATAWFLSTSILIIEMRSPRLAFTSCSIGANIWQGPHHVAKKSTKTGFSDCIMSLKELILLFFIGRNSTAVGSTSHIKNHLHQKESAKKHKSPLSQNIGLTEKENGESEADPTHQMPVGKK